MFGSQIEVVIDMSIVEAVLDEARRVMSCEFGEIVVGKGMCLHKAVD